jgi:hypothetical protein
MHRGCNFYLGEHLFTGNENLRELIRSKLMLPNNIDGNNEFADFINQIDTNIKPAAKSPRMKL